MSKKKHSISKPNTTKPKNKQRQTRKGVNKKGYTKGGQELWQTQRIMKKRQARKIRYSIKRKAHKRNLEKSTRIDEENKKNSITGKNIFVQTVSDFTDLSGIV